MNANHFSRWGAGWIDDDRLRKSLESWGHCGIHVLPNAIHSRCHSSNMSIVNGIYYKKCRVKTRLLHHSAKRESWREFVSSIDDSNSDASMWGGVKGLSGKIPFTLSIKSSQMTPTSPIHRPYLRHLLATLQISPQTPVIPPPSGLTNKDQNQIQLLHLSQPTNNPSGTHHSPEEL